MQRLSLPRKWIGLLCLASLLSGCGDKGPPNIVLITVDTLRVDHLSYAGYSRETSPNLDALAEESIQFTNAFANRGQTWPSLTTVMTGLHPIAHGVRKNGQMLSAEIPALAQLLKEGGYETGSFLTNYCNAPNRGFDTKKYFWNTTIPQHKWDSQMTAACQKWLAERSGDQPFFCWLHLMSPHADFDPPEPYRTRFTNGKAGSITGKKSDMDRIMLGEVIPSEEDIQHLIDLYDGEIAFTDSLIGNLLEDLSKKGVLENSVVVFLADHGEELLDHKNYVYHTCSLFDSVLRVPLLIRLPEAERKGTKINQVASLENILPTLLGLAGLPTPAHIDRTSLLEAFPGEDEGAVIAEWTGRNEWTGSEDPALEVDGERAPRIFALRNDEYKYIYNPGGFSPRGHPYQLLPTGGFPYELEELYHISSDPGETKNIASDRPDIVARLRQDVVRWLARDRQLKGKSGAPDAATRKTLESLGYVVEEEKAGENPSKKEGKR